MRPEADQREKPKRVLLHSRFPRENTACHTGPLRESTIVGHEAERERERGRRERERERGREEREARTHTHTQNCKQVFLLWFPGKGPDKAG